jgi:hypothetical protein
VRVFVLAFERLIVVFLAVRSWAAIRPGYEHVPVVQV